MAKYVSAYEGAKRDKEKKKKYVSAYSEAEKNKYGVPGAVGYVAGRAFTDFLRVGEGVKDAALVPVDLMMGNVDRAKSRFMDSPVDAMRERLDEEYNPGKGMQFVGNIAGGMGQSVGYGLISAIPYAGAPMMYSSIVEQGISSAAAQTGEVGLKEIGYGATVGAIEGTLESKLGAGVNTLKSLGSAILKKTGKNVLETAAKAGGKSMLKTVLAETAKGAAGEFAEEAISEAVDPALLRLYNIDENAQFSLRDVAYAGIVGGISGGIMSAGPAAINYRSAVSVGRALQESRLDGDLINRAKYTLSALEAAQTRSTGQIKGKPEGDTKETAKEWLSRTSENRRVKRLSKETAQLADKIRRNIQAYENSMKDPAMAQSEPVAALLGELRGNLFLVGYSYEADVIEQVMMEADDKQRQAFVDAINEELAAQGKKHDYTLADFDANKDDIRRGLAGRLMMDELQGNTAEHGTEGGAEAPQKPAQASTSPWDGMADNEDMSGYKAAGEAEEALLRAAVNQSVPRGSVQAMLDEYRKGTNLTPEEFAAGWSDGAHIYGRYGLNVDEASPLSRMSPEAREEAMKFGRETEEAERKAAEEKAKAKKKPAAQAGKKGNVVRGEGLNVQKLSDEQYAAYKAAEVLAEVLGTDIVIETKILTNKGKEANGYYDRKDNTIHVNINALRNGKNVALYTLGHEITHYIKEWSPSKFEALADFVLEKMGADAETAIAEKMASLKRLGVVKDTMTVAEANAKAREELVAEGMEMVLTDGKVLEELSKTDKSLWEKIRDWIADVIDKIRKYYGELNQASKTAQVLKETVESLEEIERLFTEGVREAGERTKAAGVETETTTGDKKMSFEPEDRITVNMNEEMRARILRNKTITPPEIIVPEKFDVNREDLELNRKSAVEKPLIKKLREMGYLTEYQTNAIDVSFDFTAAGLRKSMNSQVNDYGGSLGDLAKVVMNMQALLDSSILIEIHSDKGKGTPRENPQLVQTFVLMSAFREGTTITPVQFEVKQFVDNDNRLYLAVALTKIETGVMDDTITDRNRISTRLLPVSDISIPQFIQKINPRDEKFFKYIPDEFLSAEQKESKQRAIDKDEAKYGRKYSVEANDIRYSIDEIPETPDVSENEAEATEEEVSDRDLLLAMAEQMVGTEQEHQILSEYKAQMDEQKTRQARVNELTNEQKEQQSILFTSADAKARSEASKKLKSIYTELGTLSEQMAEVDRKLADIEGMSVIRNLLKREYAKAREIQKNIYDARYQRRKEGAETTELRRQTRRIYNRLYRMLAHPTKTKNVPYEMQGITAEALKAANMDLDALERLEQLEEQLTKLEREGVPDPEKIAKKEQEIKAQEKKVGSMKEQIQMLVEIFEKSKEIKTGSGANVYSDEAMDILKDLQTKIGNASIRNANREQLADLKEFYKTLYTRISNANKAFATERAASIDEMSTEVNTQVKNAKELKLLSPGSREWAALAGIRSFLWKNMKPLTVFEAIGSNKLMEIFRRVLDAEDVWITDILEAKKVLDEAKKEYGYNRWDLKERREITTADGSKVSLTLGEMMSLYAYNFREQAEEHLSAGGFVFAPNAKAIESFKGDKVKYTSHLNDQKPYRMRKEDIAKMSDMLTEEQRAYAKAVQEYLTSLGKKGNEVSSKLYGIDLFKETAYFPIKSSHDYIETSTGKSGDPNIKSRGTFKETVPRAGNPIVLEDFMEVVGNHVNTMATYHAFVLPVEDLTRVWNYTPVNIKRDADGKAILDENGMPVADTEGAAGYNSLKAEITKKYGKEANDYILQLLRDLNGGARRESAASILDKGLTAFKRSATMLSLSTIVQQPTSIIRAMAYIKPEYFTGAEKVSWETVKKYAPVAAIKEMGGFDTGTGARTSEFLNAKQYDSIKDAAKAAVTPEIYGGDPNVRAQAFGYLTEKADEQTWRYLFGACVNEQAAKLGQAKDSEAVLKAAGKRFAEVVRHTQVYDSTLTRSEFMRSKDGLMKMATAFGAEPTTVFSMAAEAIVKLERGDKTFFKNTATAIAASIIVNAVISSIIYAMRDDDEDENLLEKYTESVTSEIIEGFNPLEYLPIARDVMSVFKGYDIERTDMSLISNLYQQIELLTSSKRSLPDKIAGVSGAVGAFFGLPITNVYRDAKGAALTTMGFFDSEPITGKGVGKAVGQGIKGQAGLLTKLFGKERGDSYELYKAYVKGDKAHYNRIAARYETEADLEYALRRELRENDKRIVEAAEAKHSGDLAVYESIVDQIEAEGIFDRNIVIRAVNNEYNAITRAAEKGKLVPKDEAATDEETPESLYTSSDLNAALERGDSEDFAAILAALVEDKVSTGKTEAQAKSSVKSAITAYWKKQYLSGYQDTETRKRIIKLLTDTGLYGSRNDVATMCEGWVRASK